MSNGKIPFVTHPLRNLSAKGPPLTKESNAPPFQQQMPNRDARMHIVVEFPQSYRIKNFIFKNSTSPFLSVYGGTQSDYVALGTTKDPIAYLNQLATIIPETQLFTQAQYSTQGPNWNAINAASPLFKIRAFPGAKFSRYVVQRPWKFLVVEMRGFPDAHSNQLGVTWMEVWGEPATDDGLPASEPSTVVPLARQVSSSFNIRDDWMKDADGDALMEAPKGLAAFKPTGEAERLLKIQQANAPPKPTQAQQARPILNRNATFMQDLREGAVPSSAPNTTSASAVAPPPKCPLHPTATSVFRKFAGRTCFVCTHKDASGKPCESKMYVD